MYDVIREIWCWFLWSSWFLWDNRVLFILSTMICSLCRVSWRKLLVKINEQKIKLQRYIVVEAVYQSSGQIAPLDVIIRLKEKYRLRVVLDDESNSFGVLGSSGRGLSEHFGVPMEDFALEVLELLITNVSVVQDTSFLHHCLLILHVLQLLQEEHPSLLTKLKENVLLWKGLSDIPGHSVTSNPLSPIVFLKLKNSTGSFEKDLKLLEDTVNHVL